MLPCETKPKEEDVRDPWIEAACEQVTKVSICKMAGKKGQAGRTQDWSIALALLGGSLRVLSGL